MRNKARAISAWFDGFKDKTLTFPEYEDFSSGHRSIGDMSSFDHVKQKLQCAPFSSYIKRFGYVYLDSGLIPDEIFQLREASTGLCLETIPGGHAQKARLAPCAQWSGSGYDVPGGPADHQLFHMGNRDPEQDASHACCSGLMSWNFMQCLDAQGLGSPVSMFECSIGGQSMNQRFRLSSKNQLLYRLGNGAYSERNPPLNAAGCVAPLGRPVGQAKYSGTSVCHCKAEEASHKLVYDGNGHGAPASIRLRCSLPSGHEVCGSAYGDRLDSGPGWTLTFQNCKEHDSQQEFHLTEMLGGFQVRVGDTGLCLDAASGSQILVYPCYEPAVANHNQVWLIEANQLVWSRQIQSHCVNFEARVESGPPEGRVFLETCADKRGQRLRVHDHKPDQTFLIQDVDLDKCLGGIDEVFMMDCSKASRWSYADHHKLKEVGTGQCLFASDEGAVHMRQCHSHRTEKFTVSETRMRIHTLIAWEDNGRRRYMERCLDSVPVEKFDLMVQNCDSVASAGVQWSRHQPRKPQEAVIWETSALPPLDMPTLGGDEEPPWGAIVSKQRT
eukprot:TRINITY_DN36023_c0_g1_i1.p1 TRINITY_DN36023_c0_g1~~TRINITY_DN36023_c0_g1_i1.p1  ORF type:complete len:556 (-),score=66.99 TRINITY_DN36023_c0_g1_i1:741-2408(-)